MIEIGDEVEYGAFHYRYTVLGYVYYHGYLYYVGINQAGNERDLCQSSTRKVKHENQNPV